MKYTIQTKMVYYIIILILNSSVQENKWTFQVCNRSCNEKSACITKCCEPDQVWDFSKFSKDGPIKCRPAGDILWRPKLYADVLTKLSDKESSKLQININSSHPREGWCKGVTPIVVSLRDIGSHKRKL